MAIELDGTTVRKISFNGTTVRKITFNDVVVYRDTTTITWKCYRYYPEAGMPNHYVKVSVPQGALTGRDRIKVELYGGYKTPLLDTQYLTSAKLEVTMYNQPWDWSYDYYLILTSPSGATTRINMPAYTGNREVTYTQEIQL